jgi:polar amino acid transport system substrate-binding protein
LGQTVATKQEKTMKRLFAGMVLAWAAHWAHAQTESLTLAFNNKPPFFYFEAGEARGILVEQVKQILQRAGINYQFEELPFLRVMGQLESHRPMFAALGFSKTPEREKFVVFSKPIYRDRTQVVLVRSGDVDQFRTFPTFEKMVTTSTYTFGGKDGNAYPIDEKLKLMGARDRRFSIEAFKLPQLLVARRFDFTVLYPEELPVSLAMSQLDASAVQQIGYPDLPQGGLRYILFSQAVPILLIEKINKAIDAVVPHL